jgi:rod shape-determining protein MreC
VASDRNSTQEDFTTPLKRLLVVLLSLVLITVFLVWRIDSPRVERFRAQIVDTVLPRMDWSAAPIAATVKLFRD